MRAATTTVTIYDFGFFPRSVLIAAGDTVTWQNSGASTHTVTSDDAGATFNSGPLSPGSSFSFTTPGSPPNAFAYHCSIHPNMTGAVFTNRGTHTAAEHVLTLNAADFIPTDSSTPTATDLNDYYRLNAAEYMAPIHLATGSLITGAELLACNGNAAFPIGAALIKCPESAPSLNCPAYGSIIMPPLTGCSFSTTALTEVVDNVGADYLVTVSLSPLQRFRTVRIYYKSQISPQPLVPTFTDVPATHPFYQYIQALVASGATAGCGGGNYCPDAAVTRGQMAVFLARSLGLFW